MVAAAPPKHPYLLNNRQDVTS